MPPDPSLSTTRAQPTAVPTLDTHERSSVRERGEEADAIHSSGGSSSRGSTRRRGGPILPTAGSSESVVTAGSSESPFGGVT